MKLFLNILILFILMLIQISFIPHITIYNITPNLILVAVICQTVISGMREGFIYAFTGGIFMDLYSGLPFGVITLSLLLVTWITAILIKDIFSELNIKSVTILTIWNTITFGLSILLLLWIAKLLNFSWINIDLFYNVFYIILPSIIYNIVFVLILFKIFNWINDILKRYKSSKMLDY